jgi:hypothetical protein
MRVQWRGGAELPRSIEILDFPGLIAVGEAADRAVGAGDYGIPGHLLWIRGGCEFVNSSGIHEHPFWNS